MTNQFDFAALDAVSLERDVQVMKFGSSTLRTAGDVRRVASFLAEKVRSGHKVVAVVSALYGETDRLLAEAMQLADKPCSSLLPRHLLMGEEYSASALSLALTGGKVRSADISVRELQLTAKGDPLQAVPLKVEGPLGHLLEQLDVLVVPGFGGWCATRNQPVLLGRGGSDLTAIHVAHFLGLGQVTLIKDVDGIYSADPKEDVAARRFDRLAWSKSREISGKLIQRQALDAAERFGIAIEIRTMGSDLRSIIGAETPMTEREQAA